MIRLFYGSREVEPEIFRFSAGELSVKVPLDPKENQEEETYLYSRDTSDEDLITLILLANALHHLGRTPQLLLPYLPYSRQDRVCAPGEAFSLNVFAKMLKSAPFKSIHTLDAHSNVSFQQIDNLQDHLFPFYSSLKNDPYLDEVDCIVCPDKGAIDRVHKFIRFAYKEDAELLNFDKVRNPENGEITYFGPKTDDDKVLMEKCNAFLIVDDICDGGRTFVNIAKEIREVNPECRIGLLVSHGIFSKELDPFYPIDELPLIDVFITSDSFFPFPSKRPWMSHQLSSYPAFPSHTFLGVSKE